ncbi:chromosomal replication initiator protein DnaA [Brevibacterium sp. 50QC2O2]|uniref:chromosomal replication initiator protein DnaA n=1 Tax=Brevibacterium moorei TaxID=2968457 RepID=UPI00211C3A91|nr:MULTISPECIES: chromosomal replication initiator protein DnaA [unclassified Brevibacterium]MCQ9389512.1 chromosomal replication initiator protein DnaA [Brevibacterium sp. 50QC2O2]
MSVPPSEPDLAAVWQEVRSNLFKDESITAHQKGFLSLAQPKAFAGDQLVVLAVRNDLTRTTLETSLREPLAREFERVLGHQVSFAIAVEPDLNVPESASGSHTVEHVQPAQFGPGSYGGRQAPSPAFPGRPEDYWQVEIHGDEYGGPATATVPEPAPARDPALGRAPAIDGNGVDQLNPKYTFDSFVIGASNRFAHAAAFAVAEQPAKAYNPLFIYGDSGLGKTHLLHAIGHYAAQLYPNIRVRYVSSEEFVNDFINTIGSSTTSNSLRPAFQRRYREVDILMIDDIQFLQGKDATVEEFFHTFNALHNEHKQVVISSDQPPKMLKGFEERLRSRFEWGLLTDVQPPDLETRFAILRNKALGENLKVPDDVLEYIASRISSNIRELEGALIRVTAFANLNSQTIDVSLAETVLKDFISQDDTPEITPADIMGQVAGYFHLTIDDLKGSSRSRTLTTARQIAMYLCRELTDLSLPKIGQEFGGRDHTTVMHANKKIRTQMTERRAIYTQVTELTNRLKQHHHL